MNIYWVTTKQQETQETWVLSLSLEDPLEKKMATHSNILAWETPWTEEPGRLQSTGSQRVGHDLVTTPVLLPGESQGRGSLVGCRLWGGSESDTTDVT